MSRLIVSIVVVLLTSPSGATAWPDQPIRMVRPM